jgi:hypothetical protein
VLQASGQGGAAPGDAPDKNAAEMVPPRFKLMKGRFEIGAEKHDAIG